MEFHSRCFQTEASRLVSKKKSYTWTIVHRIDLPNQSPVQVIIFINGAVASMAAPKNKFGRESSQLEYRGILMESLEFHLYTKNRKREEQLLNLLHFLVGAEIQ